jgi:ParB family transcriptional regulator, chromosome partitioning protein
VEVARACASLIEDFGQTHQQVAVGLGRSRPAITNLVRLLELPDDIQELISHGSLSEGHGRAILMVDGARARRNLAQRVVSGDLSVRATERFARATTTPAAPKKERPRGNRCFCRDL